MMKCNAESRAENNEIERIKIKTAVRVAELALTIYKVYPVTWEKAENVAIEVAK